MVDAGAGRACTQARACASPRGTLPLPVQLPLHRSVHSELIFSFGARRRTCPHHTHNMPVHISVCSSMLSRKSWFALPMTDVKQGYVMQNCRMDYLTAKPKTTGGTTGARFQTVVGQPSCVASLLKLLNWITNAGRQFLKTCSLTAG